ncbi:MAG TPA: HYR domain-containing protein, partial [Chitinophagaceae bacterium]|nr:HYR domain-containing protein [Chitinophagaceae bacterium]
QTCANRYTITRTYRATDVCGNFTQCTQIITVNDVTAPVVTCPAAVTVSCAGAVPAVNTASVTATDNCGGTITITHISDVITNQTCPNRYTLTRTYRATDVCGNFAECTQVIIVNDQIAPVITCPANINVTTPVGQCNAVVNFTVTATDNCGAVTLVTSSASGATFPIGVTTVNATATDACGNVSTCSFTITVADAQLPVISIQPANRTVCIGANATFSVTAATSPSPGGPIAYQWQQWNGSAWVNITGANAATFTVNNVTLAMNTNTYRVVLTGLCQIVNSNAATLFVNTPPIVSINASPLPPLLLPTQFTNLIATVSNPGGTFVWFKNGVQIPGISIGILLNLGVLNAGTYWFVYTDPNGCVSTSASIVIGGLFSNNLYVYPNPNRGTFQVRFYNAPNEVVTVNVFDVRGALVYSHQYTTTLPYTTMDVILPPAHTAGIYLVEVRNASGQQVGAKRIIVTH